MKKAVLTGCLLAAWGMTFAGLPPAFTGDYDEALARAKKEKKTVLAIFSGSDWCPPCMALERNFLSKTAFTQAVTNDLVLLFVDRPRETGYMTDKAKALNPKLFRRYKIRGVPTLLFLDANGEKLAEVQRAPMEPDAWGRSLVTEAQVLRRKTAGQKKAK
jgi:thiol-disulfide isomerase/thioredoxin